MKESDIRVMQASLDQLQKQLNVIYAYLKFDDTPDEEARKKLKMECCADWTNQYEEAKKRAASA